MTSLYDVRKRFGKKKAPQAVEPKSVKGKLVFAITGYYSTYITNLITQKGHVWRRIYSMGYNGDIDFLIVCESASEWQLDIAKAEGIDIVTEQDVLDLLE
jgi:hypothetical protein